MTSSRHALGLTAYGCTRHEAALFRVMAPRYGVLPTLSDLDLSERTVGLALANRCVSVSHKTPVTNADLRALAEVGVDLLVSRSIGLDHIDVEYAAGQGIAVAGSGYSPDGVADYTLMLILMSLRHARSTFSRSAVHDYRMNDSRGRELRDLTVGVVGTGRIGSAVIERLRGFGCQVLAHDVSPQRSGVHVALDDLLDRSDVVTLHVPLDVHTHHLLDRRRIRRMKRGAVVVNTGRGALLDTAGPGRRPGARSSRRGCARRRRRRDRRLLRRPAEQPDPQRAAAPAAGAAERARQPAHRLRHRPRRGRHGREHPHPLPGARDAGVGMDRLRIGILFGGCSEEHPVSVKSAREVAATLDTERYEPFWVGITPDGEWRLCAGPEPGWETTGRAAVISPDRFTRGLLVLEDGRYESVDLDVVLPVLHGRLGEDGAIQGLLELAGIPYVGCGIQSSAVCMDKSLAYAVAERAGVATPPFRVVHPNEKVAPDELSYPVFVKPARSGSSFGVSKVTCPDELRPAIEVARQYDAKVLVEDAVAGSEVGCAVLSERFGLVTGEVDRVALSHGFFKIHQEVQPEQGSENATLRRARGHLSGVHAAGPGDGQAALPGARLHRPGPCRPLPHRRRRRGAQRGEHHARPDLLQPLPADDVRCRAAVGRGDRPARRADAAREEAMNEGFAFVDELVPGIRWDAKYATWDNFTGNPSTAT